MDITSGSLQATLLPSFLAAHSLDAGCTQAYQSGDEDQCLVLPAAPTSFLILSFQFVPAQLAVLLLPYLGLLAFLQ